jgi:hemolysin-activating ACP:hemolysin acyltransferase
MNKSQYRALGVSVLLAKESEIYQFHPLTYFAKCFIPPILLNNFIVDIGNDKCHGIMTWANINDQVLTKIINTPGYLISGEEWSAGENIFIGDIITNKSSNKQLMIKLIKTLSKNEPIKVHWQNRTTNSNLDFKYNSTTLPSVDIIPKYYDCKIEEFNANSIFDTLLVDIGYSLIISLNTAGWSNIALIDFYKLIVENQMIGKNYLIEFSNNLPTSFVTSNNLLLLDSNLNKPEL